MDKTHVPACVLSTVNNWLTSCYADIKCSTSPLKNGDKKRLNLFYPKVETKRVPPLSVKLASMF